VAGIAEEIIVAAPANQEIVPQAAVGNVVAGERFVRPRSGSPQEEMIGPARAEGPRGNVGEFLAVDSRGIERAIDQMEERSVRDRARQPVMSGRGMPEEQLIAAIAVEIAVARC
jgi:hypothetical protein